MKTGMITRAVLISAVIVASVQGGTRPPVMLDPGDPVSWPSDAQIKLGWNFSDPHNPAGAPFFSGWNKFTVGTPPPWTYQLDYLVPGTGDGQYFPNGYPGQWRITLPVPQSGNPDMPFVDTYVMIAFAFDYKDGWSRPNPNYPGRPYTCFSSLFATRPDGSGASLRVDRTFVEQYFNANGQVQTPSTGASWALFKQQLVLSNDALQQITFYFGTDFFVLNGVTYRLGDIWQPFIQVLANRQRLPTPTLKARVIVDDQQQWITTLGGTYTGVLDIAVSCSNFNPTFYYTMDGSTPGPGGLQPVQGQIRLTNSCTLRVRAYLDNYAFSEASATFALTVPVATLAPSSATAFDSFYVNVACRNDDNSLFLPVSLYITTNGMIPTTSSIAITNGQNVLITADNTPLNVLGIRPGWTSSYTRSGAYQLFVSNIVLNPSVGFFAYPTNVIATCGTPGADIHYTVGADPPEPTRSSPTAVNGIIPVSGSVTVRTKGFKNGLQPSVETIGYYIAGAEYTYLGGKITPPGGAYATAAHPPQIYSRGDGGCYVTNISQNGAVTNVAWTNIIVRAIYLAYTNIVVAMNQGEVEIDWWDGFSESNTISALYIVQPQADPSVGARRLYWNTGDSRGPLVDVTSVPKLTFFYNEDIPEPTNTVNPETVWVENSGATRNLRARSGMGFLVLLYEGGVTNGPLYGVDVVNVTPDVGWYESSVPVGAQLAPRRQVANPGDPYISAGLNGTPALLYQNNVQGLMYGAVFAVEENTMLPLMEVFWQEIGGYGFNVNWPYEMHRYTAYWPDENDVVKPARIYVRGDNDADLGAMVYIPTEFNAAIMAAEEYANPYDHGFYVTNNFYTTGPGYSLLQLKTDNGNGQPGSAWMGYEVIKSVERTNLMWQYRRLIQLSPPTPRNDYQVLVTLSSSFTYAHCKAGGADVRFYDRAGATLPYWIETWNVGGSSRIWVRVPVGGSQLLYMEYGNPYATALSDAANVFYLYDDFNQPLSGWAALGAPSLLNGELHIKAGDQVIAPLALSNAFIIEAWVGSTGITAVSGARGSICGASSIAPENGAVFMSDTTFLLSNPVAYADWDLGRNSVLNLAGQSCNGAHVGYGPGYTSVASNDVLAVAVEVGRVTWYRNGTQSGSAQTQYTPAWPLYPIVSSYNAGGAGAFALSQLRVRAYAALEPAAVLGAEQPALTLDWEIGSELDDAHQESPGSGYLHLSQGNRYLPSLYQYPNLNSQLFAVNTGTLEVWWCSWLLTNRVAAGIQIPSHVRRYRNIWPATHTNYALCFNGVDAYASSADRINGPQQFTLECWFRSTTPGGLLVGFGNARTGLSSSYDRQIYMNAAGKIAFRVYNGSTKTIVSTTNYNDGAWHHTAASLSPAGMRLYMDGQLQAQDATVTNALQYAGYWRMGGDNTSDGTPWFNGCIDDVRVWDVARTQAEIDFDRASELNDPEDEETLSDYYKCNEGTGSNALDSAGLVSYAQLYGGTSWSTNAAPLVLAGANAGQIIVASQLGGRPVDFGWRNGSIYSQNDPAQPGYNPNEEHAIFRNGVAYALRNDLGRQDTNSVYTSEPYVLLAYQNANNDSWGVQVYSVVPTNEHYPFIYSNNYVAKMITPPDPLAFWPGVHESIIAQGPGWRDRFQQIWAKAAGDAGPQAGALMIMQWYYPVIDTTWYFPSWYTNVIKNNSVPLLDRYAGTPGTPINVSYSIMWERGYPQLYVYDTLTTPKNNLPAMRGQTSVDIIYQQSMVSAAHGVGPSVKLIDPTRARNASLGSTYQLPQPLLTKSTNIDGVYYFNDLPPHLNRRFYYVPVTHSLEFVGQYVTLTSSQIGQHGYLLLNVISPTDRDWLTNYFAQYLDQTLSAGVLQLCRNASNIIEVTNSAIPFDSLALSAGEAQGTGYVTIAFNNSTNVSMQPPGTPVQMQVIEVILPPFSGELMQPGLDANPFSQQVTVRQTCDYAGDPNQFIFDWRYVDPDLNGLIPANMTNIADWNIYPFVVPADGRGADAVTIQGQDIFALDSHFFACRYRRAQSGFPGGTDWSEWTPAAYVEGWVQRTLDAITPFEQRIYDWRNIPVLTLVDMISQIGPRWDGNVPLDAQTINQWGLLQIYMTILKTAMNMSISANPPHHDDNANKTIMLAAGRIADLYTLLGNEAYADALDPTIAFGTGDSVYGMDAPSLFCFMNQTASLLDETLALLRGRGAGSPIYQPAPPVSPPVWTTPYYNRLPWNFTKDITGGEVAYALNYDILDANGNADGIINENDAAILYPQGHGDAWGHYLSAIGVYQMLLHNDFFDWVPGTYAENVANVPVAVYYRHEQKYCEIAAAKARTGADIVRHTYRAAYSETPGSQWQGYADSDTNRAWGVGEWAARGGMGAYFDWVIGNAIIPPYSPYSGIQKIDRTNVTDLTLIAGALDEIQDAVDSADRGLNPLGLARNVVPFDIDPSLVYEPNTAPNTSLTHFEQIYNRALEALRMALRVFDYARNTTQNLRKQVQTVNQFNRAVRDQEIDYTSRLVELFGKPYPDDLGPAGTYPTGYNGPDLYHWMYLDNTYMAQQPQSIYTVTFTSQYYSVSDDGSYHASSNIVVTYTIDGDSQMGIRPLTWTSPRPAYGEVQRAYGTLLQTRGSFEAKLADYKGLIAQIERIAEEIHTVYDINDAGVSLRIAARNTYITLNSLILALKGTTWIMTEVITSAKAVERTINRGTPQFIIAGMAVGADPSFAARLAGVLGYTAVSKVMEVLIAGTELLMTAQEFAKEIFAAEIEIDEARTQRDVTFETRKSELQFTISRAGVALQELLELEQAINTAYGAYTAKLDEGYRLLSSRDRFRQKTAAEVQAYRYRDMAFRIFRNDALQKYRAQFDLAARYTYLAAKAYDYETALQPNDPRGSGAQYLPKIVRSMAIGIMSPDGFPQPVSTSENDRRDGGLADVMARMKQNWDTTLRGQLGFNNPRVETSRFSLRTELFRSLPDGAQGLGVNLQSSTGQHWRTVLQQCVVSNIRTLAEFQRYCIPFDPIQNTEPGIVVRFSTAIEEGRNYFGLPLGGGDHTYDSTYFATKIRTVGIWFSNYDTVGLNQQPYIYLVPIGSDVLRSPGGDGSYRRRWTVLDQVLPVPFPAATQDLSQPDWIPLIDSLGGPLAALRRHPRIRVFNDSGEFTPDQATSDTRLIGRSVWNTDWIMIIPASQLHSDRAYGLQRFIDTVTDIKLFFETYAYPGN